MVSAPDLFDDADLSEPMARAVRRIAVVGFQALWAGRSVTLGELFGEGATVLTEAAEHLRLRGRIEFSADGHLIAVHGLCRRPTPHRIEHDDGVVNTWCALDAIGIPAALGIDAWARTQCPTCETSLVVRLSAGEPQPLEGAALWYPEVTCGHLVEDFCSGANLFCTIDHLERWIGDSPRAGRPMTIDEVAEVGRLSWADARDLPNTVVSLLLVGNRTLTHPSITEAVTLRTREGRLHVHVVVPTGPHDGTGATDRLTAQLAALRALGCTADGEVLAVRPVAAVRHSLRQQPYDEIILATLPPGVSGWLRIDAGARIERLSRLPVTHVIAGEDGTAPAGETA